MADKFTQDIGNGLPPGMVYFNNGLKKVPLPAPTMKAGDVITYMCPIFCG